MGKDFTFRASPQIARMLGTFYGWQGYIPSKVVNEAIEATPDGYLERKPDLLHVQFSDSTLKKLNKLTKKTGLSKATLVERAIDYYFRKQVMQAAKKVAAEIDEIAKKDEEPLHDDLKDLPGLIEHVMPFKTSFVSGNKRQRVKPRWNLVPMRRTDGQSDEVGEAW